MRIVINGGGGVGRTLAGILSEEQHDVTIVELRADRAEALNEAVDCHVVVGSGATPGNLRDAGAGDADVFVAATDRDEVNLLSCAIARKLGCPRNIARVRDRSFGSDDQGLPISELGIDQIINSDEEAAHEIVRLLHNPGTTQMVPLADGAVVVAGMVVAEDSPFDGRTLAELPKVQGQRQYCVAAIRRHNDAVIPTGQDCIKAGDEIFVVAEPDTIRRIALMVNPGAGQYEVNRVMVFGASDLGKNVAAMLQHDCRVKLVDTSSWHADLVPEVLSRTLVIEGGGHDMDLLAREGLSETDAFVAVTGQEETNLIGCLYAKRLGVPRVVARVERAFYRPLIMTLGVDAAVSTRHVTVNAILKYIRIGDIKAVARMRGVPVEALEFAPRSGAKALNCPLRKMRFPRGALVGVVVRPDGVVIPTGNTEIRQGERVIVFALHKAVKTVEKLFS